MKVRVELSPLASTYRSGVAEYTRLLVSAMRANKEVSLYGHFFNFLKRQPQPLVDLPSGVKGQNSAVPLRVYAKLQSFGLAPPFDLLLPTVDVTIFPNFATWPSVRSKYSATVIHDLTYLHFPELVEEKNLAHLRRVVPRSIEKADLIITVSESVKKELEVELGLEDSRCIVTPIPPDEAFFSKVPSAQLKASLEKYGINKKFIYFIGNLEPRKNLITLIEAYCSLPEKIKQEYSLILAGNKGWKTARTEECLHQAVTRGEDIRHIGFVDQEDSPALYQSASLFVMPSLYEGFGMPVLEAMASGTPVVASDIPVLREVGGDYASYANPRSSDDFARAVKSSLESPKPDPSSLKSHVRRYSWEDNVNKILTAVRSLNK